MYRRRPYSTHHNEEPKGESSRGSAGSRLHDRLLQALHGPLVVFPPGRLVPVEVLVDHLVEVGRQTAIVGDVGLEIERGSQEALHSLGVLRHRDRGNVLPPLLRQAVAPSGDLVAEERRRLDADPALLHFEDDMPIMATIDDLDELVVEVLEVRGQYEEIVEDDNHPLLVVREDLVHDLLKNAARWAHTLGEELGAVQPPWRGYGESLRGIL